MKFYDLVEKKHVEVKENDIEYKKTSNGKSQAVATLKNGRKLYKFVKGEKEEKEGK